MRRARPLLLALARILLAAWILSAVALFLLQRRLVFAAPAETVAPAARGATLLSVPSGSGWRVAALHWPAPPGARTVVHFHGNGEQLAWQVDRRQVASGTGALTASRACPGG